MFENLKENSSESAEQKPWTLADLKSFLAKELPTLPTSGVFNKFAGIKPPTMNQMLAGTMDQAERKEIDIFSATLVNQDLIDQLNKLLEKWSSYKDLSQITEPLGNKKIVLQENGTVEIITQNDSE